MHRPSLPLLFALAACEAAGDSGGGGAGRPEPPRAQPRAPAATAPKPTPVRGDPGATEGCPVTIRFGSYAMGIDQPALAAIEALLEDDPAVTSVERERWGREGEVTLCARVASDQAAEALASRIAALLPPAPRGPISVATRVGVVAQAPRRR
ncbi:MAG TPA: hypothetical protein VGX37_09925 [Allosphingosinicella sp.]|jgi:hypothetical protein|nr:hypothetical protein [Allosphingosinicella sp.]